VVFALDHLSFITGSLDLVEENARICREILSHLKRYTEWAYLSEDDHIRHSRRAAYKQLAYNLIQKPNFSDEDLGTAVDYAQRSLQRGPAEFEDVLNAFLEVAAKIFLLAAARDSKYQVQADKLISQIVSKGLLEAGELTEEDVIVAVKDRSTVPHKVQSSFLILPPLVGGGMQTSHSPSSQRNDNRWFFTPLFLNTLEFLYEKWKRRFRDKREFQDGSTATFYESFFISFDYYDNI
jgi:hypothetical protein